MFLFLGSKPSSVSRNSPCRGWPGPFWLRATRVVPGGISSLPSAELSPWGQEHNMEMGGVAMGTVFMGAGGTAALAGGSLYP